MTQPPAETPGPAGVTRGLSGARALVIAKPGDQPVRFGPLAPATASEWAAALNRILYQAPEGTVVEVCQDDPSKPAYDPDAIPGTYEDLLPQFRADPGHPENGGFPDLLQRLVMVHGDTRARQWWDLACRQVDAEDAYDEAERSVAADRAEVTDLLTQAHALLGKALRVTLRAFDTADPYELTVTPGAYGEDSKRHLQAAALETRAAIRAIGGQV